MKEAALMAGAVSVPTEVTEMSPRVLPPPPTVPVKIILPVPAARDMSPATVEPRVLENRIFEPPVVCNATVPVLLLRRVALTKVMVAPAAVPVMSPAVVIPVAPVSETAPWETISPADEMVSAPVSAFRVTTPAVVAVVTAPLKL